ncbi:hypothetical protein CDIK_0439 [Cucumispora dikerogammari]|nr:hypothetical protein CDIK_0439 [Cucumispora dikerogammari]
MEADCSITLREMKNKLQNQFNINVSIKTIDRVIYNFNWFYKAVNLVPARRNGSVSIEKRLEYANIVFPVLTEHNGENIYFIDGVGFNVVMQSNKGRSLVGTRATTIVPELKSKNISCCCAMSKNGIFFFEAKEVPYNTTRFIYFLTRPIQNLQDSNVLNAVLVLDNVSFHKSTEAQTLIENAGCRILYFPTYFPFLNSIENFFFKWKNIIRRSNSQNHNESLKNINTASLQISSQNCEGSYRPMLSFLPRCLSSEIIIDE